MLIRRFTPHAFFTTKRITLFQRFLSSSSSTTSSSSATTMQSLSACQRPGGAFLKEGTARVVSCIPTPAAPVEAKKKGKAGDAASSASAPTFDVVLSDTVLFPEGGGQPTDTGVLTIDGDASSSSSSSAAPIRVLQVLRTPNGILHRVNASLPVDASVHISIDWARRFDHMQCHSSQHLISAIARQKFDLNTTSWWLSSAPQECHIEFDKIITQEQVVQLETLCNELIRSGVEMKLHTYPSLSEAKTDEFFSNNMKKSIPENHDGAIRVVEIEGLDFNPCCGTHLSRVSQMQAVHFPRVERSKTTSKLFFYCGDRLLNYVQTSTAVQKGLTEKLSVAPEGFAEKVVQLQNDYRSTNKLLQSMQKQMAKDDAVKLVEKYQKEGERLLTVWREDVQLGYLTDVVSAFEELANATTSAASSASAASASTPITPGSFLLFACGNDTAGSPSGTFLLFGKEDLVTQAGAIVATKLEGKGGGKKGRFQGKATKVEEKTRGEAVEALRELCKQLQTK